MTDVIEYLKKFNRKERYWLRHRTLGDERNNPFTLSDNFGKELEGKLNVCIPKDAFVAMDYHFDWLNIALFLGNRPKMLNCRIRISEVSTKINKNQEDIDLLVTFKDGKTHLIFIEAKADSPWKKGQLKSKAERLEIFDKTFAQTMNLTLS